MWEFGTDFSHVWGIRTEYSHLWKLPTNSSHLWGIGSYSSHLWKLSTNSSHLRNRTSSSQIRRIRTDSLQVTNIQMWNLSTKLSKLTIRKFHIFQKWRFGTNSSHGVKFAKCEVCGSTKLPSQHSTLGYHRHASETPFKLCFAGGPGLCIALLVKPLPHNSIFWRLRNIMCLKILSLNGAMLFWSKCSIFQNIFKSIQNFTLSFLEFYEECLK